MTIPLSRRQRIIEWVQAQLERIAVADGFATDAGASLYVGFVPQLGPDDPAVVAAMTVGVDQTKWFGNKAIVDLPIAVSVCAKATAAAPWEGIESVLGDVKRAIEVEDRRLGGLLHADFTRLETKSFERDSGSLTVGVTVRYGFTYCECWGRPEA